MPVATTGMALLLDTTQFVRGMQVYSSGLEQIRRSSTETAQATGGQMAPATDKGADALLNLGRVATTGAAAIAGLTAAVTGVYYAVNRLAGQGPRIMGLHQAFQGIGGDLQEMRRATHGMVADTALVEQYNLAYQLVSKTFADQLAPAMTLLQKVSISTGQSMDYLMRSLVLAVGRGSRLIADNLAITVDWDEAYKELAMTLGKAQDELSETEKQTARMNQVMTRLQENTKAMPDLLGSAAGEVASFGAAVQNAKDDLAVGLVPLLQAMQNPIREVASSLGELFRSDEFKAQVMEIADAVSDLVRFVTDMDPALRNWLIKTGVLTTALGALIPILRAIIPLIGSFGKGVVAIGQGISDVALTQFAVDLRGVGAAAGPIGIALAGLAAAVGLVAWEFKAVQQDIEETQDAIKAGARAVFATSKTYDEYLDKVYKVIQAEATLTSVADKEVIMQQAIAEGVAFTEEQWKTYAALLNKEVGPALAGLDEGMMSVGERLRIQKQQLRDMLMGLGQTIAIGAGPQELAPGMSDFVRDVSDMWINAFNSDVVQSQLNGVANVITQSYRNIEQLTRGHEDALRDMSFNYNLQRQQDVQQFQARQQGLIAAGRTEQAAEEAAAFERSQQEASNAYSVQQQLQERSYLMQQLNQKRAYLQQLIDQRDQALRVLTVEVEKERIKLKLNASTEKSLLEMASIAGSKQLQEEGKWQTERLKAFTDYNKTVIHGAATTYQAVIDAYAGVIGAEEAGIAELEQLLADFVVTVPPIAPMVFTPIEEGLEDISRAADSTSGAVTRAAQSGRSAVKELADTIEDMQRGIEAATKAVHDLVRFRLPAGLDAGIARWEEFVLKVLSAVSSVRRRLWGVAVGGFGPLGKQGAAKAEEFAAQIVGPLDVVLKTIEVLRAMVPEVGEASYTTAQLEAGINNLEEGMLAVLSAVSAVRRRLWSVSVGGYGELGKQGAAKAGAFAEEILPVMETVTASVDALERMLAYRTGNLPEVIDAFSQDFLYLTTRMGGLATLIGDEALSNALDFKDNAEAISDAIQAGIDTIQGTATMMVGVDFLKINQGLMGAALGFMQGSVQVSSGTQINSYSFVFGDVALSGGLQLEQFKNEVVDAVVEATKR